MTNELCTHLQRIAKTIEQKLSYAFQHKRSHNDDKLRLYKLSFNKFIYRTLKTAKKWASLVSKHFGIYLATFNQYKDLYVQNLFWMCTGITRMNNCNNLSLTLIQIKKKQGLRFDGWFTTGFCRCLQYTTLVNVSKTFHPTSTFIKKCLKKQRHTHLFL